ncbi:hypothetical protein KAR91_43105 [Candidatus Pacearchaeota archaeon]|nr:hypothetical protein [Candidatus Pacearchaeota archaeon]
MSTEIKELHDKISLLDDKFDNLHTQQALIGQSMGQMADSLEKLVDLRAETIALLKGQKQNNREHDEIFKRVRTLEDSKAVCPVLHKALDDAIEDLKENRVKPMEDNQKWVVRIVIGAFILALIALVITMPSY